MIFHSLSNGPYNNRQTFRTHPEMREMCEWRGKRKNGDNEEEKQPSIFHSIFKGVKRECFNYGMFFGNFLLIIFAFCSNTTTVLQKSFHGLILKMSCST